MKRVRNGNWLPWAAAAMGGAVLVLRLCLYAAAVDEKHLITANHPLELVIWLLSAGTAVVIAAAVWRLDGSCRYVDNFGPSAPAAVGDFVLAAGMLTTAAANGSGASGLGVLRNLLAVPAAVCLMVTGVSRWKGRRPLFLFHMTVCVYFAVHMVSYYQSWSGNPQFQDYAFTLWSCVSLMLFAFYQAAFDVGSGRRRMQLAMGLMAVFSSLAAIPGADDPMLHASGCVWAVTNLCTLEPVPRHKPESAPEGPKE